MIQALRRKADVYLSIAAISPKTFLVYRAWFWMGLMINVIAMTIFVFFWRAVYAGTSTISGLSLGQTLNYIILARIFAPLTEIFLLFEFGWSLREGGMALALLRPLDFQASYYAQAFANLLMSLISQAPMVLLAIFVFGLSLPSDPAGWGAFLISIALGRTIIFFFDWSLACLTFYTTEVWGLSVLVDGINIFLSGSLIPLVMMPGWLLALAAAFPFSQALYVPISILTGITPLQAVPQVWLVQLIWAVGLFALSRAIFSVAVRKITVQGG